MDRDTGRCGSQNGGRPTQEEEAWDVFDGGAALDCERFGMLDGECFCFLLFFL